MELRRRDVFLKIEPLQSYSPLAPIVCAVRTATGCRRLRRWTSFALAGASWLMVT